MSGVFLKILNMSVTATWIALALIVLRALLRKRLPKWVFCAAWGLVAVRLVLPVTFESYFSLIPSTDKIIKAAYDAAPAVAAKSVGKATRGADVLTVIWLAGVALMLVWFFVSYIRLRLKVRVSLKTGSGAYLCDNIPSPFLLGLIKPRIYIPSSAGEEDEAYIVAHERAHIRRGDYIWKPLGYFLLSANWFNPVMWAAYILLCRDIEYACDEKVVSGLGEDVKRRYSEALLKCSVSRKTLAACPVAFAEAGVKQRIKNVLSYKKPTVWIIAAVAVLIAVLSVCFLTDPKKTEEPKEPASAVIPREEETETEDACASGHDYLLVSEVPPTCEAEGETSYKCRVCGDVRKEIADKLPHEFTSALISEANCTAGAVTEYTCSVCGYAYTETGDPAPDVHDYSVWEVLTYPGCLAGGVDKISCSRCGASYTVNTAATGHNYVLSASAAATCLTDGYATYTCSGCGDSYTETLAATGHNFAGATCSVPETCVLCGLTRGEPVAHRPGKCEFCGAIIKYNVEEPEIPSISIYD